MRILTFLRRLKARRSARSTFSCPLCGAPVRSGALGCKACGSDAQTGWSSSAWEDGADTGDSHAEFDYEAYLEREFSSGKMGAHRWRRAGLVALLVLLVLSLVLLGR